ncbi:MAG TPA: flagellar hook-basal body protein [Clostridia bacterium]|nr:flagellar hook-basal body protein [Clostridia bacterium]
MSIAFYTGVAGMLASQSHMDVTSNNIANINTVGYKTQESSFQNLLYTRMNIHRNYNSSSTGTENNAAAEDTADNTDDTATSYDMVGHGVRIGQVNLLYSQGGYLSTGRTLDFAINGEGLFAVETASGETQYTRNGNFSVSIEGKKAYLVTSDGSHVLTGKGKRISLELDESGSPITDELAEKIGLYHFSNPYGLTPTDGGSFTANDISGKAVAAKADNTTSTVLQNFLENSNVELSDQMVNMIQAQRSFQMNSRVVQAADEIDEMINNLR